MPNNIQSHLQIDSLDRQILYHLDINCRVPATEIAKKLKRSRQTVEYRIQKNLDNGLITDFQTIINPYRMGLRLYKIYLKLQEAPEENSKLRQYLTDLGQVYWMGKSSGTWDLLIGIFYQKDEELFRITNDLLTRFSKVIADERGHVMFDVYQFAKRYLLNQNSTPTIFSCGSDTIQLDETDHLLLAELIHNARISTKELATRVALTPIMTRRRIQRLEEQGVILQYRIGLNTQLLGKLFYKTIIRFDRHTTEDEQRLFAFAEETTSVQYFQRNIWQIEYEFIVTDYDEYLLSLEKLKREFPQVIRSVESLLMLSDEWYPGFHNALGKLPIQS